MKICFFSHSSDLGGGERSLLYLLETLGKNPKIKLLIILPSEGSMCIKLRSLGIDYIVYPYKWWTVRRGKCRENVTTSFSRHLNDSINLKVKVELFHPDLIVTNTSVICEGALVANMLNVPHVWYIRELGEKDHGFIFKFGFAFTSKFINDFSSKIIFNSKAVMKEFGTHISRSKSTVIYNSIEIDKGSYSNSKRSLVAFRFPSCFKLLIAGTISNKKGQLDAIKATSLLLRDGIQVELLIVGRCTDETLMQKIKNEIKISDKPDNFQVIDFVENPYPLFQKCDAVLVCSKNEAFGRTILEGMLLRKPVIASSGGGVPEIIKDRENGLLYVSGKYKELAGEIKLIINDTKLKRKISMNGFSTAKDKFSNRNYALKLNNIFISKKYIFSPPSKIWITRLGISQNKIQESNLKFKVYCKS